jgi:Tol biopolymer transport system component
MPFAAGDRIGPYEIVGVIGIGGMGEVYRAHDPRLGRQVAIKLIAGAWAKEPGRVRRFEQEARAASQLNHPNVLAVYDVGSHEGTPYLVSELLDGEPLSSRLPAGPLRVDTALEYAKQIAAGLAAAHDRLIVHRDVKPENVFVTSDGRIKILDFGIAKLTRAGDEVSAESSTPTETDVGTVIGSTPYMSPEQIRGEGLDARSDLFSLGVVLYEMLAGRAAFPRLTPADTMAAILNSDPPPLPAEVPRRLARIVSRCLEKNRERRFQSARDLAFALDELSETDLRDTSRRASRLLPWAVAASIAVLAILAGALAARRSPTPGAAGGIEALSRATIRPITDWEGTEALGAISPDGRFVAFLADRTGEFDIWLSQVGTGEFRNLTLELPSMNPPGVVLRPFGFSSDGSQIWFSLSGNPGDRKVLMPFLGGRPRTFLGEGDITPSWSPDEARLTYANNGNGDPMFVADASGGDARRILAAEPGVLHNHNPVWSADGRWIYFVRGREPTDEMDIWRIPSTGGRPERLTDLHAPINYLAPLDARTLLYVARTQDRSGPWLWALDLEAMTSRRVSWGLERYTSVAASRDGRRIVATVSRPSTALWTVPILGRAAEERDAARHPVTTAEARAPRFGGTTLFYLSRGANGEGLWRFDDGTAVEVWRGDDGALSEPPSVSPDGSRIAIVVTRARKRQLVIVSADGTGARTVGSSLELLGAAGQSTVDWSSDGNWLVTGGLLNQSPGLFRVDATSGAVTLLTPGQATNPVRSPDGRLIVYTGAFVGGRAPLLAVHPDGTLARLPPVTVRQGAYRFVPGDGRLVYLPDLQSRNFRLLDLATGAEWALTQFTDRAAVQSFDVTPDGRHIVFDRTRENSDIVLIDASR